MTKNIAALLFTFLLSFSASSQKFDLGINLCPSFPTGDYHVFYNDLGINAPPSSGFGFGLEASFWLGDKFSLGLDLSLIGFGEKNSTETVFVPVNVKSSAAAAPIMIAGKYFFSEGKFRPYIGLGVGVIIVSRKLVFSNAFLGTSETEWDQSGFVLAPKAGMQYELTNRMSLHANLQ